MLSPHKGGKIVPVGDITVNCKGGGVYYTGLGSEDIYVAHEMAVQKKTDDEVRITLHKTFPGIEIVRLE